MLTTKSDNFDNIYCTYGIMKLKKLCEQLEKYDNISELIFKFKFLSYNRILDFFYIFLVSTWLYDRIATRISLAPCWGGDGGCG